LISGYMVKVRNMNAFLSALRDFVVALAFSWLGVTLQSADDRATVREPQHPSAQTCPSGASACAGPREEPAYQTDCTR
jgi:hypothetical protein